MNGPEVDSQLAQLQQQPFHVTEELLPALLGKLVKLVQENDIKTDADMDKTIDKAAGEVLEEAKAEPKEKTDSGDEAQKEIIPHMVELETVKKKGVIKEVGVSNESKIKDAVEAKPKGSLNNTEDLEGKEKEKVKRQGRTGAECQENKEYQIKNEEGKKVEEQQRNS